jgi:suppressor of ftsI
MQNGLAPEAPGSNTVREHSRWTAPRVRIALALSLGGSLLAVAAGAGSASLAVGASSPPGVRPHCAAAFPRVIRDGFPEPPMRFSHGGLLETRLRASVSPVMINRHRYVTMNYEGSYPGPTFILCPGDRLVVHFQNDLPLDTNLHLHGFHVSPSGSSDNVFLNFPPGQRFTFHYQLPLDQPAGAFWYHPHRHMLVAPEIFAGLAGAIVVQGGLDNTLAKIPQRLMVLTSTELGTNGRTVPTAQSIQPRTPVFVNGALNPIVKIRPGQIQRWRIFNANDNRIVVLNLRGQNLQVLAEDGNTLRWRRPTRNLMIGPGSRAEVLVRGGAPGRYPMKAIPFAQFPHGDHAYLPVCTGTPPHCVLKPAGPTPNQSVLTLVSSGLRARDRLPGAPLGNPVDLGRKHVDRHRTIVFAEMPAGMNMTNFLINGKLFDPNRVDVTMKLGSVEEWTLQNTNTEWHTFHIHVNPFQVMSVNGRRLNYVDYQDNVAMPPKSTIVIRMNPIDFTGKFVIHCHVTFHEDHGMMAAVQILRKPTPAQLKASVVISGGFSIRSSAYESGVVPPPTLVAFRYICHLLGIRKLV